MSNYSQDPASTKSIFAQLWWSVGLWVFNTTLNNISVI